jgi:hypothetical protein
VGDAYPDTRKRKIFAHVIHVKWMLARTGPEKEGKKFHAWSLKSGQAGFSVASCGRN